MDLATTTATATAQRRQRRPRPEVEVGWLDIEQAVRYTGRSDKAIREACEKDPLTDKPELDHHRTPGKGILYFTRHMLDVWMLRHVIYAAGSNPDTTKG